jgi:hypothetical protein
VSHADRFWPKVDKGGSCWRWLAGKDSAGYGTFKLSGRQLGAHRVAFELVRGPIPEGMHLDHLCRNPSCVNPAHLDPVTPGENIRRGLVSLLAKESNNGGRFHAAKTHCPNGHAYDMVNSHGRRGCRTCRRVIDAKNHREARRRAREKRLAP